MSMSPRRLVQVGTGLLAIAITASLLAAPTVRLAAPWVVVGLTGSGLVAGASFYSHRHCVSSSVVATILLVVSGLVFVGGLLTIDWPEHKLPWLVPLYGHLPSIVTLFNGTTFEGGLQPNQVGGVWAAAAAFCMCLALNLNHPAPSAPAPSRRPAFLTWAARSLALIGVLLTVMSGSRMALAAYVVAILVALIVTNRRWLVAIVIIVGGLGIWVVLDTRSYAALMNIVLRDDTALGKAATRIDIWRSALCAFEDHPLTGIGLGSFNTVVPHRYPYGSVGLAYSVSQAHNVFLDTAATLGVVGLAGLLLTLWGAFMLAARRKGDTDESTPVRVALLAILSVYVVFGLGDGFSFSGPASLVLWIAVSALMIKAKGAGHSSAWSIPKRKPPHARGSC